MRRIPTFENLEKRIMFRSCSLMIPSKIDEMVRLLEVMRPKQLKPTTEFPGYS
jgi:hypothetical protein